MAAPELSIIIPTYNESSYVGRLLKALAHQSFKDFEVIISDAQSKDGIEQAAEDYKSKLDLKLVQSPPEGPAAGRNRGAALAVGYWLLFLDADVDTDDDDFLKTLLQTSKERRWQTATSLYHVRDASFLERLGAAFNLSYIRLLSHTKHPVAPGFCILTKRDLFEKNHGFDEKLFFGEDYDYVSRTAGSGFGFATGTYYFQDLRRFRGGNQFKVFFNNVIGEVYRHTHGHKIDKPPFKYEFGKHKKRGD